MATLERGAPLPTLGELVRDDRRVIVFTERDADGTRPLVPGRLLVRPGHPARGEELDELSCELNRGDADSPLLMLNHWADVFPPQRGANAEFQTREAILDRARQCARERGLPVSLIAVDHYDLGDLVDSVEPSSIVRGSRPPRERRGVRRCGSCTASTAREWDTRPARGW